MNYIMQHHDQDIENMEHNKNNDVRIVIVYIIGILVIMLNLVSGPH